MSTQSSKGRAYGLLDTLRGLCIISMVLYHGMYDVVHVLGIPVPWLHELPGYLWQQSICWTFILLSGFCWSLGHHALKRGLILVGCGAAITLITYFFMSSELIQYGVLTCLGLSTLLLIPLSRILRKLPASVGLAVSLFLFFICREVPSGFLGFESLRLCPLPSAFYSTPFLAFLGFPPAGFYSSDYFALIPWFFLFTAGFYLHKLLFSREEKPSVFKLSLRPLSFLGRHSLVIYLLHQPLLMGIFLLVQSIFQA